LALDDPLYLRVVFVASVSYVDTLFDREDPTKYLGLDFERGDRDLFFEDTEAS
jgi:hypothetical protein